MRIWFEEAGQGEPLVLLHSSATDARMWDPQWRALAGRFRVIRVEYRGFGRSPFEADGPYSDADDVAALLRRLGLTHVAIVGSSYGCRVGLELAARGLVTRMVLLNPGSDLGPTPDLTAFTEEEHRLLAAGLIEEAVAHNARTWLGPEATPEAREVFSTMQRQVFTIQLAADPEPEQVWAKPDLDAVTIPVLVVTGPHDLPFFQASARHLAGRLAGAELRELSWAGHLPSLERPVEVTELLLDYL
ncbi:alpha/beta fold hydrolase [Nonomuraea soli]|uniref:Pimeloyl-ACP methyl ester carboxylesterase n=1 Tax=Nonomuraea soli TaxID=1032476 RepID=A0A7W0CH25_9ACTN|nr:alpha/beta hydrolase [Nonomuraea soli]MBA2891102.1 pimeloyl-ACP methyl ester carboxylesterase [Nonomuraea soli]